MIKPFSCESATVYRAAGRRWFTKRGAFRAMARQKVNERCECEPVHFFGTGPLDCSPGSTCRYHDDQDRLAKIMARLARHYAYVFRKAVPV